MTPFSLPVVTGRFVTREASDLVRVTFAGGVELVGTHSHPIWSPLHQDWRPLGEFEPGDLVQTRTGLVAVQAVEPLAIRPAVYNIEVAGEHVYEVTELGVLVHNTETFCEAYIRLRNKTRRTQAENRQLAELERAASRRQRVVSHDGGVQLGQQYASKELNLAETSWVNPFEHHGQFGQGFDDIMEDAAGNIWIVEYKGNTAVLSPGQMEREWVVGNIDRLLQDAAWNPWGLRLQNALDAGTLRGVAIQATDGPLGTIAELGRWVY